MSFTEHLPEDGHSRWPKHVGGYTVYNTVNYLTVYALVGFTSHKVGLRSVWVGLSEVCALSGF